MEKMNLNEPEQLTQLEDMGNETGTHGANFGKEQKMFTQADVNSIVQERIAKEKQKHEKQAIEARMDLEQRERRFQAEKRLYEKGMPSELIGLVKMDSPETMEETLTLLEQTYKQNKPPVTSYKPRAGSSIAYDPIRRVMGLGE